MRILAPLALTILFLIPPSTVIAQDGMTAEEAGELSISAGFEGAMDRLRAETRGQADPNATDALTYLDRWVLDRSQLPGEKARAAFHQARNATGQDRRAALLTAEAAVLRLADENARAALAGSDEGNASAWARAVVETIDWRAHGLPAGPLLEGTGMGEENLTEVLDGALAVRARQAVLEAWLLDRTGHPEAAQATAAGAEALVELLLPEAAERLPPGMHRSLVDNATGIPAAVAAVPDPPPKGHVLPGLVAPLTALEVNRFLEPLNELGARVADLPALAARAARQGDPLAGDLAQGAWETYGTERGRLLLLGEGDDDALDRAFQAFHNASEDDDPVAMTRTAGQVRTAMTGVALLQRASVLKVETGGVQPGRIHDYRVTLVYPPLEGVARYTVTIESDATIVEIPEVEDLLGGRFEQSQEEGRVSFSNEFADPLRHSARIAHLRLNATGEPGASTNLTILDATFVEPDGDDVPFFKLRDGHVTVANISRPDEDPDDPDQANGTSDPVSTPLGPMALLAGLAGAALAARRRQR